MVNQNIVINCKNINAIALGKLLNLINEAIRISELDSYVAVGLEEARNKK